MVVGTWRCLRFLDVTVTFALSAVVLPDSRLSYWAFNVGIGSMCVTLWSSITPGTLHSALTYLASLREVLFGAFTTSAFICASFAMMA